jgi:Arc/MetJ-type ribon-helix-helix transcriptional regulator
MRHRALPRVRKPSVGFGASWPRALLGLILRRMGVKSRLHEESPMSAVTPNTIELPEDLLAFAEERVRTGNGASVAEVVREALEEKRLAVLGAALDEGIAEIDAGLGVEFTPDELMAEVFAELGLEP